MFSVVKVRLYITYNPIAICSVVEPVIFNDMVFVVEVSTSYIAYAFTEDNTVVDLNNCLMVALDDVTVVALIIDTLEPRSHKIYFLCPDTFILCDFACGVIISSTSVVR